MQGVPGNRRLVIGLGIAAWVAVTLAGIAVALAVIQFRHAADYPGSKIVSDHSIYKISPRLYYRRDTSYRTSDPFPRVYNWYSSGFRLGPEKRAESGCILMENSTSFAVVKASMAVMLCDTNAGRMMFVMRAVSLR